MIGIRKRIPRGSLSIQFKQNKEIAFGYLLILVEVTGLEPAASCSQSTRATNCATPRYLFGSKHTKRSFRALRATVSAQPKCLRTHLDLHSFFRTYILYHEIASLSTFFCKILRFFLHLFLHTSPASRFFSIHNCTRNIS